VRSYNANLAYLEYSTAIERLVVLNLYVVPSNELGNVAKRIPEIDRFGVPTFESVDYAIRGFRDHPHQKLSSRLDLVWRDIPREVVFGGSALGQGKRQLGISCLKCDGVGGD